MSKRTTFTSITPLPKHVTRSAAVSWLHNHVQMIRLNPLVIRLQETTPPPNASADEYNCAWYEITDEISYLPGGLYKGEVTYKACFNDLPNGIQTHTFAPAGLDLRGKWTVGGNEPGKPRETLELGMDAPREGLYVREDVDMRCNFLLTGFVKKNLTKSHKSVVDKLAALGDEQQQGQQGEDGHITQSYNGDGTADYSVPKPWQNNEQTLTPVDSNTMFSPDSFLRGSAQPQQPSEYQHERPSSMHLDASVGQRLDPHRENARSLQHSHIQNPRASTARSPQKLSYREHERIRDIAPQLPPLEFHEPNSQRDSLPFVVPYGNSTPELQPHTAYSDYPQSGARQSTSVLHDPSVQAELPTEMSPKDGPIVGSQDFDGGDHSSASTSLAPGGHITTQRLSTDFTWRAARQPGGFI